MRWIVQYTTPGAVQDYIHRVGRTARVGKQGHALLFILPAEVEYLKSLTSHGIWYIGSLSFIDLEILVYKTMIFTLTPIFFNFSIEEIKMADILKTLIIAVQDMVTDLDRKVNCISFVFMHIKQIPLPLVILI